MRGLVGWFSGILALLVLASSPASAEDGGDAATPPAPSPDFVGNVTDCSGTISIGGQAQTLVPANPRRQHLIVKNNSPDRLRVRQSGPERGGRVAEMVIRPNEGRAIETVFPPSAGFIVDGSRSGSVYGCEER